MAKILKISPKKKSIVVLNRINLPLHLSDAVVMKVMDVMDASLHPSPSVTSARGGVMFGAGLPPCWLPKLVHERHGAWDRKQVRKGTTA